MGVLSAASCLCWAGMAVSMAVIVLFDLAVRLIPTRACFVLAVCGVSLRVLAHGAAGLPAACANVAMVLAATLLAGALAGRLRVSQAIGGGDVRCMAALALGSGAHMLYGVVACCASALCTAAVLRLRGRRLPGEPVPFAPHLAVWLGVVAVLELLWPA